MCGDPIRNGSKACIHCWHDWQELKRDARELAEWIAYVAADDPRLGNTVVWERAEVVKVVR